MNFFFPSPWSWVQKKNNGNLYFLNLIVKDQNTEGNKLTTFCTLLRLEQVQSSLRNRKF